MLPTKRDGQNPAYRPSGTFVDSVARQVAGGTLNCRKLWLDKRDRTTGAFLAGAHTAKKAARRRACACATARVAARSVIGRRPRRRTAASVGISAKTMLPNTI